LIEDIELVGAAIPLTPTRPKQMWTAEWSNQLLVKITASGITGWGEVLPAGGNTRDPYLGVLKRLKEVVVGRDETDISGLWQLMRKVTFTGGYGIATGAISGIDIALWDIRGKKEEKGVNELLGGRNGKKVGRYASLSRYEDEETLTSAVSNLRDEGYLAIKLHQTGADTLSSVKMVRDTLGFDFDLMVDLNCTFSYEDAKKFMRGVHRYELKWVEEPVWPPDDYDSLAKLNRMGPVAAGENFFSFFEFKRLLQDEALTYYQPDVAKVGGLTPLVPMMELINRRGGRVALHNRPHNGWVGTLASAHAASSMRGDATVETPPNEVPGKYFSVMSSVETNDIIPAGPGLGVDLKEPIPRSNKSVMLRFH
jgi:L-alanine-DL-glutamate epimerase-like enolase superfamily enzyme